MKVLAVIPARAGSKRLPGKNMALLDGRPMLAYSILIARSMPSVKTVIVTSDDQDILDEAQRWGAGRLTRPPEYATDTASMAATLYHALRTLERGAIRYDWVVLLQPNVPLRDAIDCERWLQLCMATPKASGLLTVDISPYKLGTLANPKRIGWFRPKYAIGARKQDMKLWGRENGVFYVFKAQNVRTGRLFGRWPWRMLAVGNPREQSLANVDTPIDFKLADFFYYEYGYGAKFARLETDLISLKRLSRRNVSLPTEVISHA